MAIFQYYHPMDRQYNPIQEHEDVDDNLIRDVGTSTLMLQPGSENLKAKIFEGASRVELGFTGYGKGSKQAPTPGTFGKTAREEIRALAKINEVETSTHAVVGLAGLAGFNPQQGGFDDKMRARSLDEVKRAIDFAAEATTGGAVVVHTGEWARPITEKYGKGEIKFMAYPEEEKKGEVYAVDEEKGTIIALRKDEKFYVPEPVKENGKTVYIYKDGIKYPKWKTDKEGNFIFKEYTWNDAVEEAKKTKEDPLKVFYRRASESKLMEVDALSIRYNHEFRLYEKEREKVVKALKFYENLEKETPEKERWKLKKAMGSQFSDLIPPDIKYPSEFLKEKLKKLDEEMRWTQEASMSYAMQAKTEREKIKRIKPLEEYGIKKTADSIAQLGIHAWQKTQQHKGELNTPVYIAPENLFPETGYGSHPEELRNIILKSREKMETELKRKGVPEDEAKKLAKQHIKATFDIAHANMWWKYYVSSGEDPKTAKKKFDKWLIGEVKKLAKEGIIGHIHIADNFGYDDEHLTAGEGNVPIKEFVEEMKKAGLNEFIVEAGSFNFPTALADTWENLNIQTPYRSFGEVHRSYFGKTTPPYFIFGEYAPSQQFKGEPFYTGVPLE